MKTSVGHLTLIVNTELCRCQLSNQKIATIVEETSLIVKCDLCERVSIPKPPDLRGRVRICYKTFECYVIITISSCDIDCYYPTWASKTPKI